MRTKGIIGSLCAVLALTGVSGEVQLPTMGWSSWNTYRVHINEELIRKQADALIDGGFAAVGYRYVNIDDGWFGGRDANGRHKTNPTRFPNGLKPLVDYIHAKGLKAGIYSDAGENTCGSMFDNDVLGIKVGFYGHDAQDADFFFDEMGFDFIKIDFGGGTPEGNEAHIWMDPKERYTAIARQIARVAKKTGREIRMNVCCWRYPGAWVSDVAGSWRISGDVAATWESVKGIIDKNSYFARFQKPGHYNDMDMLEVGRGLTEEEDKTHFGMWCMMASPLLIGCDLTTIKPETAALLKNTDLISINQDPLGRQAEVFSRDWKYDIRVYVKPLAPKNSRNMAIALYNGEDTEREITAELDAIGYGLADVSVYDCFERRQLAPARKSLTVKVPPHGTRIFKTAQMPVQIALTFDDGLSEHFSLVASRLEKYGWKGLFNIITDQVGTTNHLSWSEIRALKAQGFDIGSHTLSHPNLAKLISEGKTNEVVRQIVESRDRIKEEVGTAPVYLCHPFIAMNEEVNRLCRENKMIPMSKDRVCFGESAKRGSWNSIGASIRRWYHDGVRAKDVLVHGITPSGGGWMPFESIEEFDDFLAQIKECVDARLVEVVSYSDFLKANG